jgi:transporter family-2 protein
LGEKTTALLLINMLAALAAGCVMAVQPAVNARLSNHCSQPLQASWISFAIGFAALSGILLILQIGFPQLSKLAAAPWWAWSGGLLGTYMVTVSLLVAPQLGATRWIALVLTGQILLSLVLDHFGFIGFAKQSFNGTRLLGVFLLLTGVLLVLRH